MKHEIGPFTRLKLKELLAKRPLTLRQLRAALQTLSQERLRCLLKELQADDIDSLAHSIVDVLVSLNLDELKTIGHVYDVDDSDDHIALIERILGSGPPLLPEDEQLPLAVIRRVLRESPHRDRISYSLRQLTIREELILRMRFGIGDGQQRTRREMAEIFKVSKGKIAYAELKGLRELKKIREFTELIKELEEKLTA